MEVLRISLFGGGYITHQGRPAEVKVTRTVRALLAYLLLQRLHSHPRELLAGLLWGEHSDERARSCLSTALWRLRAVLEPDGVPRGAYLVVTPTGHIGFNRESAHWLDVEEFEREATALLTRPITSLDVSDVRRAQEAFSLYTGELLEGFYDDWIVRERERLRSLYLDSLRRLMRYHKERGAYEEGVACGRQILQLEPLREDIHREVMRLYQSGGQRALAARQYEICHDVLMSELGIAPMEETRALYSQLLAAEGIRAARTAVPHPAALREAVRQLRRAMQGMDEARTQLQQAMLTIERFRQRQD